MKIWISQYYDTGECYVLDEFDGIPGDAYGPMEISNELFERIAEHDREHRVLQDILDSLRYEWVYPDDESVRDCD